MTSYTLLVALALVSASIQGRAMNVSLDVSSPGMTLIVASGEIVPGDFNRIYSSITDAPQDRKLVGLLLNSDGGNILEAEKIATGIRSAGLAVGVVSGGHCASACFLLFAAGKAKFAAPDALIGVHSASNEGGDETLMTMGATTAMARDLAGYDVPEEIIGRLVETGPGKVAWLTGAELASMGVTFLNQVQRAAPQAPEQAVVARLPNQPEATPLPSADPDFLSGLNDRKSWEAWFTAQSGVFKDGALYWTTQRSLRNPGPCNDAPQSDLDQLPQFLAGCETAKRLLASSDIKRRASPEYRRGWNSF